MENYCCALVTAGLDLLIRETPYFGADDVLDIDQPQSPGVPGAAVKILVSGGVMEQYRGHHPVEGVYYGRRFNRRKKAHGREIHLYRVVSVALAREFLKRHRKTAPVMQMELF